MAKPTSRPAILLGVAICFFFGAPGLDAQLVPSGELLVPYFEVDYGADSFGARTTLFAVSNCEQVPIYLRISLHSNWGIEMLTEEVSVDPAAVFTANLSDWLIHGKLPTRTLAPEQLQHLQEALSGKPSSLDGLYYSTEMSSDVATGYVLIAVTPFHQEAIWGDFFLIDPARDYAQGDMLVDLGSRGSCTACRTTCLTHGTRFLEGGAFDGGTKFVVWTPRVIEPSPSPYFPEARRVIAQIDCYSEQGELIDQMQLSLLPLAVIDVGELSVPLDFGWMRITTDIDSFLGLHLSANQRFSVTLETVCLPRRREPPGIEIHLEKYTNGEDADLAPGPALDEGQQVDWTYDVSNLSEVPLHDVQLADSDPSLSVICPRDTLDPGETMQCAAAGEATECSYENIAAVVALGPNDERVRATDLSHYHLREVGASIDIEKLTSGDDNPDPVDADDAPGPLIPTHGTVIWTFVVQNDGHLPLHDVRVVDDVLGEVCTRAALAPGESFTCQRSGEAQPKQHENLATVTAKSPCEREVSDADPSHYYGSWPDIQIEKSTNGFDADTAPGPSIPVGDAVTWTYVVTNTGDETLSNIQVADDQGVTVSCPTESLAQSASMTCTAHGTATCGPYRNLATVAATGELGQDVGDSDPSHYTGSSSARLVIEKATNGRDADSAPGPELVVGAPVDWTYVVTNTGDVTVSQVEVSDSELGDVPCPASSLAPGASMTCTLTGTAVSGQYSNVGTVSATGPCEDEVGDSDPSHYLGRSPGEPGIDVEKSTNGHDADAAPGPTLLPGSAVQWTYVVTNTGAVPLTEVTVIDDELGAISCPETALESAESMTCVADGVAVCGPYDNVATARGTAPNGAEVAATDPSHYLGLADGDIVIEKATNGEDADSAPGPSLVVGTTVTWTYVVTNTGQVPLTGISVTDDRLGDVCQASALAVGQSLTCTAQGLAVAGQYANLATVTAQNGCEERVTGTDPSHYFGGEPDIDIEKATNGQDADEAPGPKVEKWEVVVWTYRVENVGTLPLVNVTVTDDHLGPIDCPKDTLAVGEFMICEARKPDGVSLEQRCRDCQYVNLGTATGTAPDGTVVSDIDPSHHHYDCEEPRDEGCTPGYWKNHLDSWAAAGYSPSQTVASLFGTTSAYPALASATLLEALDFGGGPGVEGAARILLRAAVAAALDAAHPGVDYPLSASWVVAQVDAALASGDRDTMLALAFTLDSYNNLGCPLR